RAALGMLRGRCIGSRTVRAGSTEGCLVTRVQELFDLSGQVAVLTGVASGIGKASALMLSAAGATIVGGDIDDAGAQATVDEITGEGGTACARRVDLTKRADGDPLVAWARAAFG